MLEFIHVSLFEVLASDQSGGIVHSQGVHLISRFPVTNAIFSRIFLKFANL